MPIDFIDLTGDEDDLPSPSMQPFQQDSTSKEPTHAELSGIWQIRKKPVASLPISESRHQQTAKTRIQKSNSNTSTPPSSDEFYTPKSATTPPTLDPLKEFREGNRKREISRAHGLQLPPNGGSVSNYPGTAGDSLSKRHSTLPSASELPYEIRTQRLNYDFYAYNPPIPEHSRSFANGQSGLAKPKLQEVRDSSAPRPSTFSSLAPVLVHSRKRTVDGKFVKTSNILASTLRDVGQSNDAGTTIGAPCSVGATSQLLTDLSSGTSSTTNLHSVNQPETNSRSPFTPLQPLTSPSNLHNHLGVSPAGPVPRSPTTLHAGDTDLTRSLIADMTRMPPGSIYTPEEDTLIIHLKEDRGLRWPEVYTYFPHKPAWNGLQNRYSRKLKSRSSLAEDLREPFDDNFVTDTITNAECTTRKLRPNNHTVSKAGKYVPILRRFGSDAEEESSDLRQRQVATDLTITESATNKLRPTSMRLNDYDNLSGPSSLRLQNNDSDEIEIDSVNMRFSDETVQTSELGTVSSSLFVHQSNRERLADEAVRDSAALSSITTSIFRPPVIATAPLSKSVVNSGAIRRKRASIDIHRPYLSNREQKFVAHSIDLDLWDKGQSVRWDGKIVHVDFTDEEVENLARSIRSIRGLESNEKIFPITAGIVDLMRNVSASEIHQISWHAQTNGNSLYRTRDSIESFLGDACEGHINRAPSYQRLGLYEPARGSEKTTSSSLRLREMGLGPKRANASIGRPSAALTLKAYDTMGPLLTYTGTSGDVTTVSWAPNGELFAAGSAALTDDHSMQYNEPNNLLLGDLTRKTLRELPDHAVKRPRTSVGANATEQMYLSQDSLLFTSVTAVQFSPDSQVMLSAGYDRFVRVWQVGNGLQDAQCIFSCKHQAPVDLLAVNLDGLFATGSQRSSGHSIQVTRYGLDLDGKDLQKASFSSQRAKELPDSMIVPSCLRWGNALHQQYKYLLCGFTSNAKGHRSGEVCVFDVEAEKPLAATFSPRNVFDAAWSPNVFGRYAVGSVAGANCNRGTKSVVRLYDSRRVPASIPCSGIAMNKSCTMELECPALDINDVVFNPYDDNIVSVGCTDSTTYLWDFRKPNEVLLRLKHGRAIMELDESLPREEVDTGIRFLSWGHSHRRLFTGSSDGIVAAWDPCLSPDDTDIRNVIQLNSSVMSGEFSPDFSNLLLGEVNGSISMLAVGRDDMTIQDFERFSFQDGNAQKVEMRKNPKSLDSKDRSLSPTTARGVVDESGMNIASKLVTSKLIQLKSFGDLPIRQAVQGPLYVGPFDNSDEAPGLRLATSKFQTSFRPSLEPCKLKKCRLKPKLTEEEQGDSGAWQARIAEHVRYQIQSSPAAKSAKDGSQTTGLTCLRCKRRKPMKLRISQDGVTEAVRCPRCNITWRVDILGYAALTGAGLKPGLLEPGEDLENSDSEPGDHEILIVRDAVPAHYHSLWHDRPASPL